MTAPALKIDALIDELIAFQRSGLRNDLKLRAFRSEVRELLPYSPGDAHMALGIIASLEEREDEACREHEAALRCGWTLQRALNYAVTLQRLFRHDEAIQQARNVMQRDPGDLAALEMAVTNAYLSGRFRLTAEFLDEYRKRVPDKEASNLTDIENEMQAIRPMIEQSNLSDDQTAAIQWPACAIIRTLGREKDRVGIDDFVGDDGQIFLSRTFRLPLAFEDVQRLNDQLVEQLIEHDDWPLEQFIVTLREKAAA
ncbi:MAG: hypothetical protein H6974_09325 [Gammaproteobacteria bacterium]|nr:hypothetical protein [Gammaproteobacteria bacterium]